MKQSALLIRVRMGEATTLLSSAPIAESVKSVLAVMSAEVPCYSSVWMEEGNMAVQAFTIRRLWYCFASCWLRWQEPCTRAGADVVVVFVQKIPERRGFLILLDWDNRQPSDRVRGK
jgi:hypothetical protein